MRLLNTKTYALEEFPRVAPPYAILSHTWGTEEVTYQHMRDGLAAACKLKGFAKVEGFCRQASLAGYDWVWIDTCCIDQSSTAEVSEAINSMYGWYQRSAVCFVYLADVPRFRLTDSRWFERGWTLQELVAPRYVEFYTSDWMEIGTKLSLEDIISSATGVPVNVLRGGSPRNYTTAERLSWAAGRRTTKQEDEAYCLLGLFDINMPIIYGEGARAFERLQQEILRQSEDFSMLAWSPCINSPSTNVLAPSPAVFSRPDLVSHLPSTAFEFDDAESMILADVGALSWADLQPHRWDSKSTSFPVHQFLFDPPLITGRGMSVTLPIDTDEFGHPEENTGYQQRGERDVLAWIYTNVSASRLSSSGSRGSRGSSRSSWGRRRSSIDGGVMVCVWLTITSAGDSYDTPVRAVRTPGRGAVCVPNMFMGRFKPRHVYLQLGQDAEAETPQSGPTIRPWERSLSIAFNEYRGTRNLSIISHYPPTAIVQHPENRKDDSATEPPSPKKNGSLWGFHTHQFGVALSGGRTMDASGALHLSLKSADTEAEDSQFVALFGLSPSGQLTCHLEPLDQADLDARGRDFWVRFLWRRKHRSVHNASGRASDRSVLVLPCGIGVGAAAKQRLVGGLGGVVPTLTLSTFRDGGRVLAAMDRLLSIN
ncbi:hypothetical protein VUR80DRAFT_7613 [Thermomyces stellatus]